MLRRKTNDARPSGALLLRRTDQLVVAGLVFVSLIALAGWWVRGGGWQGRLVEVQRQPPRSADFVVDVNAATWPELAQLPQVGETLARRIVESRRQQGPFRDHADLRRVRGIGPKTIEQIKPYLAPIDTPRGPP